MMNMIKPCPFCGQQVKIYEHGYYGCPVIEHTIRNGRECVFRLLTVYGQKLEDVVELWNRRADDDRWRDDGR